MHFEPVCLVWGGGGGSLHCNKKERLNDEKSKAMKGTPKILVLFREIALKSRVQQADSYWKAYHF